MMNINGNHEKMKVIFCVLNVTENKFYGENTLDKSRLRKESLKPTPNRTALRI